MPLPIIAEQDFEREVLRSELPVLIDFSADWCAPCKTVEPEVEALARELEGKAKVVKIDIDKSKRIATSLRIQAVPTFMVFAQGPPGRGRSGRAPAQPAPRDDRAVPPARRGRHPRGRAGAAHPAGPGRRRRHARRAARTGARASPARSTCRSRRLRAASPSCTCSRARRSSTAAPATRRRSSPQKLAESGMPVGFLEGGFLGWEAEALPIERPD